MTGDQHDSITRVTSLLSYPIFLFLYGDIIFAFIGTISYFPAGYYLSPDLDCRSNTYKRWFILRGLWVPYQKLIGGHRNKNPKIFKSISLS